MAHEEILGERVVEDPIAGADDRLAFSGEVPSHTDTGSEILIVGLVEAP